MTTRALDLPAQLWRRLAAPAGVAALGALVTAGVALLLRRAKEPTLPRMSDEWLHDRERTGEDPF